MVIAGTKVDGAGEERSPSEQEAAVVKQGEPVQPGSRQTGSARYSISVRERILQHKASWLYTYTVYWIKPSY